MPLLQCNSEAVCVHVLRDMHCRASENDDSPMRAPFVNKHFAPIRCEDRCIGAATRGRRAEQRSCVREMSTRSTD